jgi:uncharacterized protein YpiB (UPF0302 family)
MSNWQQRIEQLKSSVTNSVGIFSSLVEEANKNGLSREELSNNIVKALDEADRKEFRSLANALSKVMDIAERKTKK